MNFERGLEPKEALKIGRKARAILIEAFYFLEREIDMHNGCVKLYPTIIEPDQAYEFLVRISQGKIMPEEFVIEISESPTRVTLQRLDTYRGQYIKFMHSRLRNREIKSDPDYYDDTATLFLIPEE